MTDDDKYAFELRRVIVAERQFWLSFAQFCVVTLLLGSITATFQCQSVRHARESRHLTALQLAIGSDFSTLDLPAKRTRLEKARKAGVEASIGGEAKSLFVQLAAAVEAESAQEEAERLANEERARAELREKAEAEQKQRDAAAAAAKAAEIKAKKAAADKAEAKRIQSAVRDALFMRRGIF